MGKPTPEQRADSIVDAYVQAYPNWPDLTPGMPASIEASVAMHIRAAVEAERARCWKAVLALSSRELREHESATADVSEYGRHLNRHSAFAAAIAAIRQTPEPEVSDGG